MFRIVFCLRKGKEGCRKKRGEGKGGERGEEGERWAWMLV